MLTEFLLFALDTIQSWNEHTTQFENRNQCASIEEGYEEHKSGEGGLSNRPNILFQTLSLCPI